MTETASDATTKPDRIPTQPIQARYGSYYRNARYVMVLAIFVMAGWFGYDGWAKYPAQNAKIHANENQIKELSGKTSDADQRRLAELDKERKELGDLNSDLAIQLQKLLAIGLPLVGIGYLLFVRHRSRGTFTLDQNILTAPGHPPVPIEQIKSIDGKLWRKKGIAFLNYDQIEGKSGQIRLDAFIYDPKPMDDLYEVIARHHGIWEQTKPLPPAAKK